ncbi:MAG: Verru Chthon cassette protein [Prosthecobacter sp.]|nr:Verru Chthon cassette protein [Prosthecobacter sp.]
MYASKHSSRAAAFSLVEILVVLGILAIIVTASVPYISGILTATRLRSAADTVYNRLLETQSLAMLFNTDAELRLYEVPDLIDTQSRPLLRKLRIFTLNPPQDETTTSATDVFESVGTVTNLEEGIEVSSDIKFSSIIDLGFQTPGKDSYGRYIALRFRPDGSAVLQPSKPWFLTLHEKDAQLHGPKLKNFVTVQIDPATGRLRTFQP